MKNKYFPDEDIESNDLYFVCYMIERVARHIKQKNKYVVNTIGRDGFNYSFTFGYGSCISASDKRYINFKRRFCRRDNQGI